MSRGKRYSGEQKLNLKKVFALIIIIIAIILFIAGIKNLLNNDSKVSNCFTEISYFTINADGKWGVLKSDGQKVVNTEYDNMIIIPNAKKEVFLCMYDVNYSDGTYKTKAINANNEQLFTSYSSVEPLSNYKDNEIWYDDNALKVGKDGKFGLINLDGNQILSCDYEEIDSIKGVKNSIAVKKDGVWGVVNSSGDVIITPAYAEVTSINSEYKNGYIVKNSDGKKGIVGFNKEQLLECKYADIKHVIGNDLFVVKENDKWNLVGKNGNNPVELSYEDVISINGSNMVVKNGGKFGVVGTDKSDKIACEYSSLVNAYSDFFIAEKDGKFGIINLNNDAVVPFDFSKIYFSKEADCIIANKADESNIYIYNRSLQKNVVGTCLTVYGGYIRLKVGDDYKYYNLKLEEKNNKDVFANNTLFVAKNDGKYGLVNKDGTLVVQYQYEDIKEQNVYGYVAVKKDGKWGVIDQYGNVVVEPKFIIEDISNIDVIGTWHQAQDVNNVFYICK